MHASVDASTRGRAPAVVVAEAPRELHPAERLAELRDAVARAYLAFRREYYHEAAPDLSRAPSPHAEIRDAELAGIARSVLRLVPQAVHSVPILGGLLEHLEQVADIHSISEQERRELHNMAILFLHGTDSQIQPWYASWLLASAQNLANINESEYYFDHPWDGILYRAPRELQALEIAVKSSDVKDLLPEVERIAAGLVKGLRDPVKMHADLAFCGPGGDQRHALFQLKTTAALGLGVYLIINQFQQGLRPRTPHVAQPSRSRLAPIPSEMDASVLSSSL